MKNYPSARTADIEELIGETLKHAPTKPGGTRYKANSRFCQVAEPVVAQSTTRVPVTETSSSSVDVSPVTQSLPKREEEERVTPPVEEPVAVATNPDESLVVLVFHNTRKLVAVTSVASAVAQARDVFDLEDQEILETTEELKEYSVDLVKGFKQPEVRTIGEGKLLEIGTRLTISNVQIKKKLQEDLQVDGITIEGVDFAETRGDFIGQLTCHNPRGSSVVDYFIVSEELLDKVAFFKVHDFLADLSDHSQVSIMLNIDMKVPVLDIQSEHSQITPPKYIWNDESVLKFQTALTSNDMQEKISKFMSDDSDSQNMTLKLNDIICEAADKSLKQILPKTPNSVKSNTKTIKKQPKWFDFSLIKMRKQLDDKEKLFKKYNNDPIVRGNFFSFLKLYRKTRKNKYKQFRKDLVVQLDNMRDNNPSQYWALLQSLSNESSTKGDTSNISNSDWLHYFKKLNSNSLPVNKELIDSLNKLEKHNIFTELDYKITEKEINEAVKSLKNNKSSSFDSIINEMLKCSQSFLLKCFVKIFNKVLTSGKFPDIWAKGFIVPLHKSGSKDDPSNFRGITIDSIRAGTFRGCRKPLQGVAADQYNYEALIHQRKVVEGEGLHDQWFLYWGQDCGQEFEGHGV
ncbi:unnamed protein product [Mytilus edulis]|uniref:Endonuclease/exonuclease/phosphatase domain-containing protein n=1 Tax=Mytilus edulis TaxID=6550 RepID=A0A8S3UY43_MYTED|nr:unnamed protein product [Mytilus edulis]